MAGQEEQQRQGSAFLSPPLPTEEGFAARACMCKRVYTHKRNEGCPHHHLRPSLEEYF